MAGGAVAAANAKGRATAAIGQAIGGGISDLGGAYVKFKTTQEASRNGAAWAVFQDQSTQKWNEIAKTSDPNDPSVRQKFLEEDLEPAMQKFKDAWTTDEGQKIADQWANSFRSHMYTKTAADAASKAGQAAVQNQETVANTATNSVLKDPSSYAHTKQFLLDYVGHTVVDNPALTPEQAAAVSGEHLSSKLKDLAKAQVLGWIDANPVQAKADIAAGKYDKEVLDAADAETLDKHADGAIAALDTQRRLAAAEAARVQKAEAKTSLNTIVASFITQAPDGSIQVAVPPGAVDALKAHAARFGEDADMESIARFTKWASTEHTAALKSEPGHYADFADRVNLDPQDARHLTMGQVLDATRAGYLSDSDSKHFMDLVGRERKPEERAADKDFMGFVNSFKTSISKTSFSENDGVGDVRFQEFHQNADRIRAVLTAQGKSETEIQAAVRGTIPAYKPTEDELAKMKGALLPPVVTIDKGIVVPKSMAGSIKGYKEVGAGKGQKYVYNASTGELDPQ